MGLFLRWYWSPSALIFNPFSANIYLNLYWYCSLTLLILFPYRNEIVALLCWYCFLTVLILFPYCADIVSLLCWYCFFTVLILFPYFADIKMLLIYDISYCSTWSIVPNGIPELTRQTIHVTSSILCSMGITRFSLQTDSPNCTSCSSSMRNGSGTEVYE